MPNHERMPHKKNLDRPPIETVADYIEREREAKVMKYLSFSFLDRLPIKERARALRYGPTAYSEEQALLAAIEELVEVSDEEIGVSIDELEAIIRSQIRSNLPKEWY